MSDSKFGYLGKNVLAMTSTTHYWMGKVVHMDAWGFYLDPSAWIPVLGEHSQVLASGEPDEHTHCQPHPAGDPMFISRGCVIIPWKHKLWRKRIVPDEQ